jgi:outer membrane lipoprotein-sorting protein
METIDNMKNKFFSRRLATLTLAAAASFGLLSHTLSASAGPSPADIMGKVAANLKLEGSEAVVKMTVVEKSGSSKTNKLSMATKLYEGGSVEKRIYRFLEPTDVKGTSILVFDNESKADDLWIFMPALRKVRRIVSSDRGKAFMGSEFSYADLTIPDLSAYSATLVKEEPAGGEPCYVLDITPKDPAAAKEDGYSKKTYWVSKTTFVVRKGVFYDAAGAKLKEMNTSDIKALGDKVKHHRALKMEMVNLQSGRKSMFTTEAINYAPNTKDEYFTTAYLERQ